jgi:hypothetical protein
VELAQQNSVQKPAFFKSKALGMPGFVYKTRHYMNDKI